MKQVYIAEDGKTFDSEAECATYETLSGTRNSIEKWAHTRYGMKQGQTTSAVNKALQWEMDRQAVLNGTFEFIEHPKPEKKSKASDPAIAAAA
jgi:hypothetical protein